MKVLLSCPPMIGQVSNFRSLFTAKQIELHVPDFVQTLSEAQLLDLLPQFDGWIIGDDPANERVLSAGKKGRLKACVKWGIGVDNVDFEACKKLGIPVSNTPGMFGGEVADLAVSYLLALARHTFRIDRAVRQGQWIKPAGTSLQGLNALVIGFGDIGMNIAKRLLALDMNITAYDPHSRYKDRFPEVRFGELKALLPMADFVLIACALTPETRYLINAEQLSLCKAGVRIINVSRGGIIDEAALVAALESSHVAAAALDVFENEPLPAHSSLRGFDQCIFGTHNGSNTVEAVNRASLKAIEILFGYLGV